MTQRIESMTDRQRDIVDFIVGHIADFGYPPSVREIGEYVGLSSPSSVHHHLRRLEELGLVLRVPGRCRATTPVEACPVPAVSGAAA